MFSFYICTIFPLQEEVLARMEAEKRLKEAEKSLNELGHAVEHETPNVHQDVKYEMVVNVNKLKSKNCIALAHCLLGNFWGLWIYFVSVYLSNIHPSI